MRTAHGSSGRRRAAPRGEAKTPSPVPLRAAAAALLGRVLDEKQFFDLALAREAERFNALSPGDRIAARRLAVTALRRLGEIDQEIDARLAKPLPKKAAPIRHILRIAAAETAFLDGPAHAAVDAAVRLAKRVDARLSGLVNAVSRRIAEAGPRLADRPRREAGRLNTPAWLWRRLVADWGEETAEAVAAAHLSPAPLDLTVKSDPEQWAARLGGDATPVGVRLRGADGAVPELDGYREGEWWVQDLAAALPARLLDSLEGARALDLCAAPGGKTLQLASAGAEVTALDVSEPRLARLRENLERTKLKADIVVADALSWRPENPFDVILLDAPCSASGTIRRHPELPWIKDDGGLEALARAQDALLDAAWDMLAPQGRLIFCTCSVFKIEGESRLEAFLARRPSAARAQTKGDATAPFLNAEGALRTKPSDWAARGGMDGFFAALLRKGAKLRRGGGRRRWTRRADAAYRRDRRISNRRGTGDARA